MNARASGIFLAISLLGGAAAEGVSGGAYRVEDALATAGLIALILLAGEAISGAAKSVIEARRTRGKQ